MDRNMLIKVYFVIFLLVHTVFDESTGFKSFYGIKTNVYPKSSCNQHVNIRSKSRCLGTCMMTVDMIIMISHDEPTKTCMCCSDITGSDIIGPNWTSYVRRTLSCANDYVAYNLTSYQLCLRYFPVPTSYSIARANCLDGGNLYKIDSQEKFDIFKEYHEPIANTILLNIWVESLKVGGQWQFHDGSPIPFFCPISMSNGPEEIHFRARVSSSPMYFLDGLDTDQFYYSCEYRLLYINK